MTAPYLPSITTDGILDLSHWQPPHDFSAAKQAGIRAVICKATQGATSTDPTWAQHAAAAEAAGLLRGAYAFLDASDPTAQADHLIATVADTDVRLFLDAERNASSQVTVAIVAAVVQRIVARTARAPVIYVGRSGPDGTGDGLPNTVLAACDLWLPEYGRTPICPPGWTRWRLWQYTDGSGQVQVPGVGQCDHSRFDGTADELASWWVGDGAATAESAIAPTAAPTAAPAPETPARILSFGMTGADVVALQKLLVASGHPVVVDGYFAAETRMAVTSFQRQMRLTADGIVGSRTRAAIETSPT